VIAARLAHVRLHPVPTYRVHDTVGDDLGVIVHPAPNVEPGDVVQLAEGREAIVTATGETGEAPIAALLEVVVAPSAQRCPTRRPSGPFVRARRSANPPAMLA
jgi:hypothetical protein